MPLKYFVKLKKEPLRRGDPELKLALLDLEAGHRLRAGDLRGATEIFDNIENEAKPLVYNEGEPSLKIIGEFNEKVTLSSALHSIMSRLYPNNISSNSPRYVPSIR